MISLKFEESVSFLSLLFMLISVTKLSNREYCSRKFIIPSQQFNSNLILPLILEKILHLKSLIFKNLLLSSSNSLIESHFSENLFSFILIENVAITEMKKSVFLVPEQSLTDFNIPLIILEIRNLMRAA